MDRLPIGYDTPVSSREADVLAALAAHLTNAEIAARLFISVRTVESHVSSLLRKLQVSDRRGLALVAARVTAAPPAGPAPRSTVPSSLTSFVGRSAERAALADALVAHRLVTALGPGGVGKTRPPSPSPATCVTATPTTPGSSTWSRSPMRP